jgi:TnpA family transposase
MYLYAETPNIMLEPVVHGDIPALTRGRLNWVRQSYLRSETIARANTYLVNQQAQLPLARRWGGGEVASVDGLRFRVPDRAVHAGSNPKYFGLGRGVTFLNFVSDQYSGFHNIVVPGTLRDSLFILEGLLEQESDLNPRELMTDTAGASAIVFGLFWMLGYQFSPRLADIGGARFWRIDPQADCGPLNDVSRHRINRARILNHWDDMLRIAASLKLGKIRASELMRSLFRGRRPSGIARAFAELGRIASTIHHLTYIDDESYRRRTLAQLNNGESRHSLSRRVFHGKQGELGACYREGQEEQLGVLGLVVNILVLWNTLYTQAALDHLQAHGFDLRADDIARLSPLAHENFNFLGRYSFQLPPAVARGELRPLRVPDTLFETMGYDA